jgi:hypothetical protein
MHLTEQQYNVFFQSHIILLHAVSRFQSLSDALLQSIHYSIIHMKTHQG